MAPPAAWLEGLLLPPRLWKDFIECRLAGRPPGPAIHKAWARKGGPGTRRRWADRVRARTEDLGGELLPPSRREYPRALLELEQPPPVLFVRGDCRWLNAESVAVVGSRNASLAGQDRARRLGLALARAEIPVVSGLARGVDAAAHHGCLDGGGTPVGVLGTGLDAVYPSGHAGLQEEVARCGCLVTEYPPGGGGRPWCFVARNRLIAALSKLVVVVEAARRSGALITAGFAAELGREVAAFPGPVEDSSYAGCLEILRDGARLVRDAGDVLEEMGRFADFDQEKIPLGLDRPRRPAEIARLEGLELGRVLAELAQLELEGRVRRVEGGRYVASVERRKDDPRLPRHRPCP